MEPATISAISSSVGAAGSLVSGFAQNSQADRQAATNDANAKIATNQAAADAAAIRNKAVRVKGAERAASGASGIAGTGFADAIADSDIEAELDAQTSLYNGRIAARNFKAQADASRAAGRSAEVSGAFGAGTQALSGYGNWKYLNAITQRPGSAPSGYALPQAGRAGF